MIRAAAAMAALAASLAVNVAAEAEPAGMVAAPPGLYRPFFKVKGFNDSEPARTSVRWTEAFRIDIEPVTNAQFLEFVTAHPQWRKSQIKSLFADERYLRRWPSDLELADPLSRTSGSRSFCRLRLLRETRRFRLPRPGDLSLRRLLACRSSYATPLTSMP